MTPSFVIREHQRLWHVRPDCQGFEKHFNTGVTGVTGATLAQPAL